jgi:secondary thiamine-phosphate synthase enzyme
LSAAEFRAEIGANDDGIVTGCIDRLRTNCSSVGPEGHTARLDPRCPCDDPVSQKNTGRPLWCVRTEFPVPCPGDETGARQAGRDRVFRLEPLSLPRRVDLRFDPAWATIIQSGVSTVSDCRLWIAAGANAGRPAGDHPPAEALTSTSQPAAAMVHQQQIAVETSGHRDMHDLTADVTRIVAASGVRAGIVHTFVVGSTAAVGIIEFEPGLRGDLPDILDRLMPPGRHYGHEQTWHDGNAHSHLQATVLGPSLSVPVADGQPVLGTWQQIFLLECDVKARRRIVVVTVVGD